MKKLTLLILLYSSFNLFSQETKTEVKKDSIPKALTIEGKYLFLFNQSSFSNWSAGGNNTIAGNVGVAFDINYKKNKWNWDNKINSNYGLSYVDEQGLRKTNDDFEFNSIVGLHTSKYWFVSFFSNFKTQYTKGYEHKEDTKTLISNFFSPAYWSFGPGILWKKSDNQRINIAPATARYTFVSDQFSGKYGVEENRNTNFGLGLNLSAYFKSEIMPNITMENIVAIYSDYFKNAANIDIDYQLNFAVKINKYISTNLNLHLIVDDDASSKIQFKEAFGLGLYYAFNNK
ncbi:DUF3078 domain-containing protein [Tenacibaculum insulae]|uniref:DUF3078 domain-containing protein n=1 Tax=Tenacibaculum insulae TaxID=2029677 RepID=UPI003AB63FF7